MNFGFENTQPEWTVQQKLWLLSRISEGVKQRDIYNDLAADNSENRPNEVERWKGTFGAFKKRLQRLTRDGIDPAIDTDTGNKLEFDLATAQGRYDYWVWLAKTTASQATRVQALQMIEKLAPQFADRAEQAETRQMITRGREILNDANAFVEVVNKQLTHALKQGCDDWCVDALASWIISHPKIMLPVLRRVVVERSIDTDKLN